LGEQLKDLCEKTTQENDPLPKCLSDQQFALVLGRATKPRGKPLYFLQARREFLETPHRTETSLQPVGCAAPLWYGVLIYAQGINPHTYFFLWFAKAIQG